jgi:hypothetical protein
VQEDSDAHVVLEVAEEREALFVHAVRTLVLAGQPEGARIAAKRSCP